MQRFFIPKMFSQADRKLVRYLTQAVMLFVFMQVAGTFPLP